MEQGVKECMRLCSCGVYSQAVHDGSSLSLLSLALPLVDLQDQFEEGALGGGDFSMSRPPQVLELTNHQVAFLGLEGQTTHTSVSRCLDFSQKIISFLLEAIS